MIVWWIGIPFAGALVSLLWPRRVVWQVSSLLQVGVACWMTWAYLVRAPLEVTHTLHTLDFVLPWWGFPTSEGWLSRYQIQLFFATDGTALWLGLALALVGLVLSLWPGWTFSQPRFQIPALFILQGFALWTLFSYDLIAFYVGFEAVLFPMYYLLLTSGSPPDETRKTALEFLLYTLVGSVPMLAGILYGASEISRSYGVPFTTNFLEWLKYPLPSTVQVWVYGSFVLAFWVKLGLFPLHGWVLSLYRVLPFPIVVLSSAFLTKLGGIGWLRFAPAFPEGHFSLAPYLGGLGVFSFIGAGLGAFFQKGLRGWMAYGSISHLSLIAVGVAATSAAGFSGAAWYMVNHSVLVAAQLLLVGAIVARVGTDEIARMGGLARSMPHVAVLWMIVALASIGLPGLSQFPAEFLILTGSYVSYALRRAIFIGVLLGVVVSAAYTLPVLRRVLFGPSVQTPADLERGESVPLWILGLWIIGVGFVAAPFLSEIQRTTTPLVEAILFQALGVK
ncbi:MAG: NADH-quinone oxidoreductase subunit M [Bacteroidia bacterium]|nr:NADH-quinone oxidoreductase subunit M [Bacteroidia bacterium]